MTTGFHDGSSSVNGKAVLTGRVCQCQAGVPPGAYGGADYGNGALFPLQEIPEQQPVQMAQDEPLGSAGGTYHYPELIRLDAFLPNSLQRIGSGEN